MMMCFFWWFLFRSISFVFSIHVYDIYKSCWFYLTSIVCDDLGLLHDCSFRYSNWKWFSRLKELVEEPHKLPIFIFPEGTCIHQHQRHAVQEGKLRGRGYSISLYLFVFLWLSLYISHLPWGNLFHQHFLEISYVYTFLGKTLEPLPKINRHFF